ncbi:MAG: ABC transporter substrate-binding protein [Burkholderiales bacterium]|nr:ABC transporter substrate-binding protein [Burkholderiales bacterium]
MARRAAVFVFECLLACLLVSGAAAQALTPLRVISFEGGWNLPLWVAQRQGFFEANGLAVQHSHTPNSGFLIRSLLDGKSDIALALIDNLVAYQEGQGEVPIPANPDLFAFMGGDGGFLSVLAAPGITRLADLKGKTLSVDAMSTGAAFVLREIIARSGLAESDVRYERAGGTANRYRDLLQGKHDATLLRTPFDLLALNQGFRQLALAETLGPYQGTVGMARRAWAKEHEAALIGFIRAYRAATDWLYEPANRDVAEALLVANSRDMTPALAKQSYALLLADKGGLTRDLSIDLAGLRTVLALRAKYGVPKVPLGEPAKYISLTYHDQASAPR